MFVAVLACRYSCFSVNLSLLFVFCQAEDGIRYLVRSRGLGDVYKRQPLGQSCACNTMTEDNESANKAKIIMNNLRDIKNLLISEIHF